MTTTTSEHWRIRYHEYLERQERIRELREQLKAARDHGKAVRHAERLRRLRAGDTEGRTTA